MGTQNAHGIRKKMNVSKTYLDIKGWFDWELLYTRMAEQVPANGCIVELGVCLGRSICYLGSELKRIGKTGVRVFGVDNFVGGEDTPEVYSEIREKHGDMHARCISNIKECGVSRNVKLIIDDTVDAAHWFADGTVDFLFIDSNHTPEHLRKELRVWLPKMKRPTWIAGHDIHGTYLREAVVEFFPQFEIEGGCWVGRLT